MSVIASIASDEENKITWVNSPTVQGFRVSSTGRVQSRRSSKCIGGCGGSVPTLDNAWHDLKPWRDRRGYSYVTTRRNKKTRHHLVHRLVLEAFVGPAPEGTEALHGDGDPRNNRVGNLRWGTHVENHKDAVRHDRVVRGSRHRGAKLNEAKVVEIHAALAGGESSPIIAARFGVCRQLIESIRDGRKWAHVPRIALAKMSDAKAG